MDYNIPDEKQNQANEPSMGYGAMKGMKLRIFHSWEEMTQAEIEASLKQTPEERIRETVELILRVYGVTREELSNRKEKLKLTITRYE